MRPYRALMALVALVTLVGLMGLVAPRVLVGVVAKGLVAVFHTKTASATIVGS